MKPPVNIDHLMEEWAKDSVIDETEPGRETAKTSSLHAKYLRILSHHNLVVTKLQSDYNKMRKIRWEYYNGDLNNPEDLAQYGFEPMTKKVLRADINMYLDSDTELNNILLKKMIHQEIVDCCERILKEINNRTFSLGNLIKWEMFTNGS